MSTEKVPMHPLVRLLKPADLDRVMEIENSAYAFPWTLGIFEDCLRVGYVCQGLNMGNTLAGYSVQSQSAGECHLLNICIDPAWQGRGLGSLMLEQCIRLARQARCNSMFLEVRSSNRAGISLYHKRGFHIVGERPDYYRAAHGRESAMIMFLDLDEPATAQLRTVPRHDPF